MEITNELLAAYAEGNVTPEERKAVREFLTEHPDLLESVAMMMDEDYGMEAKPSRRKGISFKGSMFNRAIEACTAVFPMGYIATGTAAAHFSPFESDDSAPSPQKTFNERLDELIDEIY